MKRFFIMWHPIIVMILFLTCNEGHDPGNNNKGENCSKLEAGQKGFIQLTKKEEPGEPLVVYGRIIDRKTNHPVNDVSIFLYQTDTSGIYNDSGAPDNQARIRGTVHTNENGCFKIKTILPGDYPGQKNSRHLHYVINAKGYKEIKSILFFKGFTTSNISDQGPLSVLDIKKDTGGTWIGSIDIHIED